MTTQRVTPRTNGQVKRLPAGFEEVSLAGTGLDIPRRLICSISGMEKSGKTDWALRTSPEPVFHFQLDPNSTFIARKIVKETKREIHAFDMTAFKSPGADYKALWKTFVDGFRGALAYNEGTIVVDTGTEKYELIRLAYFGKLSQVLAHNYGPVNAELKLLYREAYASDMNLIEVHKMRKEYINDKTTGAYEPACWGDTPFEVQANIEAQYVKDPNNPDSWPFWIKIENCNANMDYNGEWFQTDSVTYQQFLDMVYG